MDLFEKYIKKYINFLIIPIFFMIITIVIDTTIPYLQKIFVDDIIIKNRSDLLIKFFTAIIGLAVIRCVIGYFKEFLFDKFALKVAREIRIDLFNNIKTFEFSFFDNTNTGELLSRMGEDVDIVWETLAYGLRLFIEGLILFIASSVIMFFMSKSLTLLCLATLLPVAFIGVVLNKKFWAVYSKISDQTAKINSTAQQDISGIRLVKALARERYEISKFLKVNKEYYKLNLKQARILSVFLPLIELLTNITPIIIIIFGGFLVIQDHLSIGTLLAFSSYIFALSWCAKNLGAFVSLFSQNKASMDKIFKILNRRSKIISKEDSYCPEKVIGDICFKNVYFKYNDEYILQNINLDIKAGSQIAIMGETGCGKTSLLALIGRYYDVSSGEVLVDGVNVKDWNLACLRSNMATVFQDTFLFSDSIKDNIDFGLNTEYENLINVAKESAAHEFILEMDDGYDTLIGERGVGLSGGQKQRIAIARALIKKSPILILDDATSALDMETEFNVLRNLSKKQEKATTFIIAHRISGVKDADLILFMKDGKIIESGNHPTLLQKKGFYYNIYKYQFQDLDLVWEES